MPDPDAYSFDSLSETEPVFWISEIRILSDLSSDPEAGIRTIPLEKGLNIIWSEPGKPGSKKQRGRGHAAGKTSFCRALRYVLGEENYGNKFIEEKIAQAREFNKALIYASVWIGQTQWSVFRPLNRHRRHLCEFAVSGAAFSEAIEATDEERLPYADFAAHLEESVLDSFRIKHFDSDKNDPITWLNLFMPLARDQEAHLSSIHNWRDATASATPSKFTPSTKAFLMRALLGVADERESEQLQERAKHHTAVTNAETTLATYRHVLDDEVSAIEKALDTKFDLPKPEEIDAETDPLFLNAVKTKALEKSDAKKKTIRDDITALLIEETEQSLQGKREDLIKIEARIEERVEVLHAHERRLKSFDIPEPTKREREQSLCDRILRNAADKGRYCKVPLQDAIDNCQHYWRCEIKKRLQEEPQTATEEFAEQQKRAAQSAIAELKEELAPHLRQIAEHRQEIERLTNSLKEKQEKRETFERNLEEIDDEFTDSIQSARNILQAIAKQEAARKSIRDANKEIKACEESLAAIREDYTQEQDKLSRLFHFVISQIVSDDLTGELVFSKIDINAILRREGELESAAYRALRCLSYDFTALTGRLCGLGHHPGFLLHDSPRESDLEISLYHQFFEFVHDLEKRAPNSFQYIVTTTEAPPDHIIENHVRLPLDGSKPKGRLYRQNLR